MKANGYYNHPRFPLEAGCGLIEEDSIAFTSDSGKTTETPSFPLEIFPKAIRDIIEALEEYENYNVDFTSASFLTVFAAAMGNTWSVRFMTGWVSRPIIYMVLVGSPSCGKTPPLQQAVAPLLKLDGEYDMIYCKEMETYRRWERMSAKQRERHSLPEEMEMPQRKCHVVVDSTVEALIGTLRDNPRGVLIYKDEIDSLLSNFNRYNGSDEGYFLSLFSGTPFKYSRKSNNEHIFLANPYCSIIGTTQPGRLDEQFGGKRMMNGFSSRFLKVYPEIDKMPSWNDTAMPDSVLEEWERIIRKVVAATPSTDQEGKATSIELLFSQESKLRIIQWKDEVNNKAYAETDSDAVRALCGKLETYLVRFCLVIQIMHCICGESGMDKIEPGTAELAIRLTEYFRNMESRIAPEIETGILDNRFTELLGNLRDSFTTAEAVREALQLGISESSVKRFLRDGGRGFVKKKSHGCYRKI
ncbi:DUF3987 domain-containing protein [Muribaculum intestinale]|uniref:DUF3987 domain-containing protein n=2 Tax=Bacteroidales TaxID=171549 RepID=A0A1B1S6P7_9BACT|nr:DUF3987 domain-containing protein [Muribaculum intestinale]ANU62470.1 hypothetical protein A4V02_01075 [Muribaculum intestinale]ASB37044.1 hypothetical protein ADH68_02980 [Muribaculum intestinale]PWB00779.1 DUF3987 domain-containing protein [Muribaculum intestinale]PWB07674.1 DUF3987 domain-containing protein [Muribaculum intestinale]QQR10202.1 DUF3987 domain-containing protein [Muribaculum intestinale]